MEEGKSGRQDDFAPRPHAGRVRDGSCFRIREGEDAEAEDKLTTAVCKQEKTKNREKQPGSFSASSWISRSYRDGQLEYRGIERGTGAEGRRRCAGARSRWARQLHRHWKTRRRGSVSGGRRESKDKRRDREDIRKSEERRTEALGTMTNRARMQTRRKDEEGRAKVCCLSVTMSGESALVLYICTASASVTAQRRKQGGHTNGLRRVDPEKASTTVYASCGDRGDSESKRKRFGYSWRDEMANVSMGAGTRVASPAQDRLT